MTTQRRNIAKTMVALSAFVPNLFMTDNGIAQATATDTMNVSASIVNPLAVTPSISFSLNFKTFAIKGTGSYVIKASGGTTISSGVTLGGGGSIGTARINVPQNVSFTLSIPTFKLGNSIYLTVSGGTAASKKMTAKSIFFNSVSGMSNITATLRVGKHSQNNIKVTNPADQGKMGVGARIFFDANQVTGVYTGSYIVRITL